MEEAVLKRVPDKPFNVLFSGGVDSYVIIQILKKHNIPHGVISVGVEGSKDLEEIKKSGINTKIITLTKEKILEDAEKIVEQIRDSNPIKIGVGIVTLNGTKEKEKVVMSGLGADELFAGYERMRKGNETNETITQLLTMYEKSTYRDDSISMSNNTEMRLPYLDKELITYCLGLKEKIKNNQNKNPLRELAEKIGVPKEFAWRKKTAAQYGTGVDKVLTKTYKHKAKELNKKLGTPIMNICALFSGGKDSLAAIDVMKNTGYKISCLLTIKSSNAESYMFHTPNIELTKTQAESMHMPIITINTTGEKEKELEDLKNGIKKAIQDYDIEGVVCGAIQSDYQRMRVLKICEELGIKFFAPLWGINQESYFRDLIKRGWEIMFSSINADGMRKEWIGKIINEQIVNEIAKMPINTAGEGGEFETIVTNSPLFKKRIIIKEYETKQDGLSYYMKINDYLLE